MATHPSPAPASEQPSLTWQVVWLVGLLAITFAAAALGSAATSSSLGDWYAALNKPAWNPPNWIFGPVWTTLYFLMAIAAWLVYRSRGFRAANGALVLYGLQLALNVGWSVVFFGLQMPGLALTEIVLLWLAIAATLLAFRRHSTIASWLLAPYLAWTSFAAVLNFTLWRLNA